MEPFDGPATADNYYGGWVPPSEDAIDQFKASLPSPEVEDTAIFGGADLPEDAHPWKAVEKVSGQSLPPLNQGTVGACCGFGAVNAMLVTSAVEIANGEKEKWHLLSPSYIYGGSRVVIGERMVGPHLTGMAPRQCGAPSSWLLMEWCLGNSLDLTLRLKLKNGARLALPRN